MTREEAKAILENDIVGGHVEGNARFMDAFWMAVDTLSQEPCTDAVSRETVLDAIRRISLGQTDVVKVSMMLEKYVKKLPSVTQKPDNKYRKEAKRWKNKWLKSHKSGKWIDYRDDGFVECPFCGHATNCEDDIDELHYCFYCGACMKDGRTLDEFIEDSKESEEISERNMKMWEEIFKAESEDKE